MLLGFAVERGFSFWSVVKGASFKEELRTTEVFFNVSFDVLIFTSIFIQKILFQIEYVMKLDFIMKIEFVLFKIKSIQEIWSIY